MKIIFLLALVLNACTKEYGNTPGVVLSFDDYYPSTWEQHLDLFDKYNAKATFFVLGGSVTQFMLNAQKRGHEIGYHTITHPDLTKLSREQFLEETVLPINVFKESGIELTSFAYPYGKYESWMHEELLKHYKIVRGVYGLKPYSIDDMKTGFLESASIDKIMYKSEISFQDIVSYVLGLAREDRKIIILTCHSISDNDLGITPERLEYVLKKAKEYGLPFYLCKDFQ